MKIHYNVTGKARKNLAQTIGNWLEEDVNYEGAPTFAYTIDYFTLDRDGSLIFDDRADSEVIERLLEHLYDEGFESDISETSDESAEEPSIDSEEDIDCVKLCLPDTGFDDAAFERLKAICEAKKGLITKAFDAVSTEVVWNKEEKNIGFPWFKYDLFTDEDQKVACIQFLNKLMEFAKEAKRVTAKEKEVENEKYAFRCFLLRLGLIGDEFKGARKFLLSRLSGNAAFKSGAKKSHEPGCDPIPTPENIVPFNVEEAKERLKDPAVQEEISAILNGEDGEAE